MFAQNAPRRDDPKTDERRTRAENELRDTSAERMHSPLLRRASAFRKNENVPSVAKIRDNGLREVLVNRKRSVPYNRREKGIRQKRMLGDVKSLRKKHSD